MKQKSKTKPILLWDEYTLLVTSLAFYRDYGCDKKSYKEIKKMFDKLTSFLKDETEYLMSSQETYKRIKKALKGSKGGKEFKNMKEVKNYLQKKQKKSKTKQAFEDRIYELKQWK